MSLCWPPHQAAPQRYALATPHYASVVSDVTEICNKAVVGSERAREPLLSRQPARRLCAAEASVLEMKHALLETNSELV